MVFRKKRENGSLSNYWYYEFKIGNKRYRGSTYKTTKSEALEFEGQYKNELRGLLNKNEFSKVKKDNLIRFREKITSEVQGASIKLDDIWESFVREAPAKMRIIPNQKGWKEKEAYFRDFLLYVKEKHPQCWTMRDITPEIAEQYIGMIKTSGRYSKSIHCKGSTYKNKNIKLAASSINEFITQLKQVFRILAKSGGLIENPFDGIQKLTRKSKKRDVYEIHELEKIDRYLKNLKGTHTLPRNEKLNFLITEAIFVIGINTGMRRGDLSLLRWSDVNFNTKVIKRELLKTGEEVFIPMSKTLYSFLRDKEDNKINEYVTPELAEMYQGNAEGISYRFKKMLEHLDITSLKSHSGRSRRTSNKDIHSLRHTFCYLHGMQGTRIIVLQSMVGHLDKKMTESYMMHQTEQLKREAIDKFSLKAFQPQTLQVSGSKNEVLELISDCDSEETIEKIKSILKENKNNQFRGITGGKNHV